MKRTTHFLALVLTVGALLSEGIHAEASGRGRSGPGAVSTISDLPPTKSGRVIEPSYSHLLGDVYATRSFPLVGLTAAGRNFYLPTTTDPSCLVQPHS
jgi:hypothetical protein